jgi:hypothetical protein
MVKRKNLIYGIVGLLVVIGIILAVLGGMGYFNKKSSGGSSQPFVPPKPSPKIPANFNYKITTTLSNATIVSGPASGTNSAQSVAVQYFASYAPSQAVSDVFDHSLRLTYTVYFKNSTSNTNVEYYPQMFDQGNFVFQGATGGLNEGREPVSVIFSGAFIYTNSLGEVVIGPESDTIELQIPQHN